MRHSQPSSKTPRTSGSTHTPRVVGRPRTASVQQRVVRRARRGTGHSVADGTPAQRHAGHVAHGPVGAAATGERAVAALDCESGHGGAEHCRDAGRAGQCACGGWQYGCDDSRRSERGRPEGRHEQPDQRLDQRAGAHANERQRQNQRQHCANGRQGNPELGDVQRRAQYVGELRTAKRLGGAQSRE
ncbi:hypothetical protein LMG16407_04849 [Pandoraea apista]|nr:hypothetical protein LMG16407_04849 [Pandoraea apista]